MAEKRRQPRHDRGDGQPRRSIQGLVAHMRTEQQMIREWADGQGEQNREIKKLLERIAPPAREELGGEGIHGWCPGRGAARARVATASRAPSTVVPARGGASALHAAPRPGHDKSGEFSDGPSTCTTRRIRFQLLAGFRRRAFDAGTVDRVPAVGVFGGAVLPVAGSDRQGQGARTTQRQDRAIERPAVTGKARQAHVRRPDPRNCAPALPSAESERDRIKGLYDGLAGAGSNAPGPPNELNKALEFRKVR